MNGYIHAFETFGTKDELGIRLFFFMQGCPQRCLYSQNFDNQLNNNAKIIQTPEKNFCRIPKSQLQAEFVLELYKIYKENNIYTVINTSGLNLNNEIAEVLEHTNFVLLDIKQIEANKYKP